MQFRHSWRPYQSRVLNAIHEHLDDGRIHIVAAPGAGKTTLGLEIFRLLGKNALVLSPTRIIRDQWIERLRDFVDTDSFASWTSNSIRSPQVLTSITYQALHAGFAEELNNSDAEEELLENDAGLKTDELNGFIRTIEQHQFEVLILDEAHHLRAEWWRALEKVCEHFPDIILVSLTATPPYDSQAAEWGRYEQLCGPIDEEISVPELVKAGSLCAHQDYLWACDASNSEKQQISEYDKRVYALCDSLFNNGRFVDIVMSHPWLSRDGSEAEIIKEPHIAIALLVFIKAKLQTGNKTLMNVLDFQIQDIPELGRYWWQVLIEAMLFSKTFQYTEPNKAFIEQLKRQLRASELLKKKELSLERSRRVERSLSLSASKIEACLQVHQLEYDGRGESLRQVVLTDYIRDETLNSGLQSGEVNLGAWPVFERLTSNSPIADQIGLLSGRISIIPTGRLQTLLNYIDHEHVKAEAIGNQGQYQKITAPLNQLTAAFTQLLIQGEIKVLVGTRSLLGEGWDAPVVNSLVLASSVGSFMLTNQMRGRAIRINPSNKDKTSSIWHLVAVNPKSYAGWSDFFDVRKRFDTFVGLSEKKRTIESGFDRLDATALRPREDIQDARCIANNNRQMTRRYKQLHKVADRWKAALTLDKSARVIPSVKTNTIPGLRSILLKHSFKYLTTQLMVILTAVVTGALSLHPKSGGQLLFLLTIGIVGGLVYKLPKTLSVLKTVFLFLPIDGALKQMGRALAESLCIAGFIETSMRQMKVNVFEYSDGEFYISLAGATFYESSLFADCIAEILAPIDNPRYLVLREGRFLGMQRVDYHAVPIRFAVKKELAKIFYKSWQKHVSLSELIYTRTEEGRKRLLKAKMKSFSSNFRDDVRRQDRWQ